MCVLVFEQFYLLNVKSMFWLIVAVQIPKCLVESIVVFPFLAQSFTHHKELFEVDHVLLYHAVLILQYQPHASV